MTAGSVAFAVAAGRWGDVNRVSVAGWGAAAVVGWRRRTGPERAIRVNGPRSDDRAPGGR